MTNAIEKVDFYENQLKEKEDGLKQVMDEIIPLQTKKSKFEEDIKSLRQLILSEKEESAPFDKEKPTEIMGRLKGKTGYIAYQELASIDFKGKTFGENDIRELANKEGLTINGQPISGSYSRALIAKMIDKHFVKKTGYGKYRHIE